MKNWVSAGLILPYNIWSSHTLQLGGHILCPLPDSMVGSKKHGFSIVATALWSNLPNIHLSPTLLPLERH